MDVKERVALQRQELEAAVAKALELAAASSDAAEVAITKSTGLSVSTRMCEVENVEFNSDGALGITVYRGQRKGSASTSDLSEKAIRQTVLAALDIAQYTSADPYAGPAPKELMVQEIPDLDLFHPDEPNPDVAAQIAIAAERAALGYSKKLSKAMAVATIAITAFVFTVTATVYWLAMPLVATALAVVLLVKAATVKWSAITATPWRVTVTIYGRQKAWVCKRRKIR